MNRLFSVPSERKLRKMLRSERPVLERRCSIPNVAVSEESIVSEWPPVLAEERIQFLLERVEDLGGEGPPARVPRRAAQLLQPLQCAFLRLTARLGLTTRGIFRVSGESSKINEVVYAMASNGRVAALLLWRVCSC